MSFLKSLKKLTKSPLGRLVGKAIKATPIGGKLAMAAEKVKGVARSVRVARQAAKAANLRIEPLSVRAAITKVELPAGTRVRDMPAGPKGIVKSAPTRRRRRKAVSTPDFSPLGSPQKAKRTAGKAKASPSKRKAPTGGKDFKALSVSWRAAGKPGTWINWVKTH